MKKRINIFGCILLASVLTLNVTAQNWLNVQGNQLIDSRGQEVRLTGVNWFGFETNNLFPHGIWSRDTKSMLQQIKDQGFNSIRIPWCNEIMDPSATININAYGTDPYTGVSPMNEYESTLETPLELLDVIVEWCQENNMKIILDNHSREPDGYMNELLWYTDLVSEEQWINDWVTLTERYRDYDAVVAMDINNEPHGKYGNGARWGDSHPDRDWNKAAERCGNAILQANPNVLILVEGIEEYQDITYWWGGNLLGVRDHPVQLSNPDKLVYSPHEYGPTVHQQSWFTAPDFPENMPAIWDRFFNYIYEDNISPLLVGEFGIRDPDGLDEIWFDTFMAYMGDRYSWTYWCWNPNSGDTGGLLDDQWTNVVTWKMDKLTPYLAPEIPNGDGTPVNQPPDAAAIATPSSGTVPLTVDFDTGGSGDPDNDPLSFSWNFGDGTTGTGISPSHTYNTAGSFTATVTVSDGMASDQASIQISVQPDDTNENTPPVANISVTPTSGTEPLTVSFDASGSSDADNDPLTYSWSFGDGNAGSGVTIDHTYITADSYTATLTVNDGAASDQSSITIMVDPDNGGEGSCDAPVAISLPFSQDGTGEYCWVTSSDIAFVNSWNMDNVEINGVDYSNQWSNNFPDRIDGNYYIYYNASVSWAHFEAATTQSAQVAENGNEIAMYPNPFHETFTINLTRPGEVKSIIIVDQLGRTVQTIDHGQISGTMEMGTTLKTGMYFIQVHMANDVQTLIIHKN